MRAQLCHVWGLLFCLLVSATSYAVDRPLPANAQVGQMNLTSNRTIAIDGNARRLTAGAQIRNHRNMLIQPQNLTSHLERIPEDAKVHVLYTENNQGHVHRIWILNDKEVKQYKANEPSIIKEFSSLFLPDKASGPSN